MARDRSYYRRMRAKHIRRKKRIASNKLYDHGMYYYPFDGMYSKGKVHCSCYICNSKDLLGRHVKTRQEIRKDDYAKEFI